MNRWATPLLWCTIGSGSAFAADPVDLLDEDAPDVPVPYVAPAIPTPVDAEEEPPVSEDPGEPPDALVRTPPPAAMGPVDLLDPDAPDAAIPVATASTAPPATGDLLDPGAPDVAPRDLLAEDPPPSPKREPAPANTPPEPVFELPDPTKPDGLGPA